MKGISLLLRLLTALFLTLPDPTEANSVSPKIRGLFEFHVADLQMPSRGSVNLSTCCLPGTWIPPDLCSAQCRLFLEVQLQPFEDINNTAPTPVTTKANVFTTGVIFTKGKLENCTLDFRVNLHEEEMKGRLYLLTSLFHRSPVEDVILLARLKPQIIKQRPRKVWTTTTIRSADESAPLVLLTLAHRFNCPPDYYGDTCELYCSPRDSRLGHYKCDPNDGHIVCLPGWHGNQCTEAICKKGCLHGICDSPGVCKCREGWEGEACDQCIPFPGCNHGTCKLNWTLGQHEPFTCECQTGWSGMLCTIDTQFCSNRPDTCQNHGVCHNTPTDITPGYACQCQLGYEGYHCEYSNQDCRVHRCNGHGICQASGNCVCYDGFYGSNCQFNQTECWQSPCEGNKSICVTLDSTSKLASQSVSHVNVNFRCECQPGLSGMNCESQTRLCDARPCLHGGKCVELDQDNNGYQCVCLPHFRGRHCELSNSACQHLPCANAGQCVDRAQHVECRCPPGWTGPTCRENVDECATLVCKNGAACRDHPGTYECLCTPGWSGHDCSQPIHNTELDPHFPSFRPPQLLPSPPPNLPSSPSPSPPYCISACGEESTDNVWPHTLLFIRCAVVTSVVFLVCLIILASFILFLRRRKIWRHKKSGFEELQTLAPPPRPSPVYWNSIAVPEPLLLCASGNQLIRQNTLFGEVLKTPLPRKEEFTLGKSIIYDVSQLSRSIVAPQRMVPLRGLSMRQHAIVCSRSTLPPPYEELPQSTMEIGKGLSQSFPTNPKYTNAE